MGYEVFLNLEQILTQEGVFEKSGILINENDLRIHENASLVVNEKKQIEFIGKTSKLPRKFLKQSKRHELAGHFLTPGLVDCHTHMVFAGERFDELAMRLEGKTYQQIAALGGGIKKSVLSTRKASFESLLKSAMIRVERSINYGIRILEIKSGYGLDWKSEEKILKVIKELKKKYSKDLIIRSTFLAAHDFPPECKSEQGKEKYVESIINVMLPEVAQKKLADACDVFFDEGYFNREQSYKILSSAKKLGLDVKIHADELKATGGAKLSAELKALSADHLLKADLEHLKEMAKQDVVAVLLPGTAFYLGLPYVEIEKLREAKVTIALATDFNPGTCPTQNLPFIMSLACLQMKMTMPEAMAAATYGGAKALGLNQYEGFLRVGNKSSFSIFKGMSYYSLMGQIAEATLALCNRALYTKI